jgi:hypothetical protein
MMKAVLTEIEIEREDDGRWIAENPEYLVIGIWEQAE